MLEINRIHQGDCLILMKEIPDKSVNLILCDLPYGVTNRNKWDCIIPIELLWKEYKRVLKEKGIIILTATQPFASRLIMSNLEMFRYDLIWEKPLATGFLNANRMPLRNHESILVFYNSLPIYNPQKTEGKPYKMVRRSDSTDYGEVKNLHQETNNVDGKRFPKSVIKFSSDKEKLHPTQKPLALFEYLILTYSDKGALVLDNCMGSGTTAVACLNLNRNFIGIELEQKYIDICNKRIMEVKSGCDANDDGIPPNNKLLGILPNEL
jgi:site-specific DNA-methyltransferase (adenine-specific)